MVGLFAEYDVRRLDSASELEYHIILYGYGTIAWRYRRFEGLLFRIGMVWGGGMGVEAMWGILFGRIVYSAVWVTLSIRVVVLVYDGEGGGFFWSHCIAVRMGALDAVSYN